jgi:hypothetical protein
MKKITQIIESTFFIVLLLIIPNIQAAEFNIANENIQEQIDKNLFDDKFGKTLDIWEFLEFLFALLINIIDFILKIFQKFVRLLLVPLNFINYLIWVILQILFPH